MHLCQLCRLRKGRPSCNKFSCLEHMHRSLPGDSSSMTQMIVNVFAVNCSTESKITNLDHSRIKRLFGPERFYNEKSTRMTCSMSLSLHGSNRNMNASMSHLIDDEPGIRNSGKTFSCHSVQQGGGHSAVRHYDLCDCLGCGTCTLWR